MEINAILAQASKFLEITLGNILTMGVAVISIVVSWQKQRDHLDHLEGRMTETEEFIKELSNHGVPSLCASQSARISLLEQQVSGIHTKIEGISVNVEWIKEHLERQERRHRA